MKNTRKLVVAALAVSMAFTSCKKAPTAAFEVQDGILYATKDIKFTNDSDGGGLDYQWTFTDAESTSSSQENPTAVWNTPGTYKVTLAASNKKGDHETSETITIEEYIPYVTVQNNTPAELFVALGTEGLSSGQTELDWAFNNRYLIVESGKTVDVQLWESGSNSVDISGVDELYMAIFGNEALYSVDAEDGVVGLLAWHAVGLDKVDMDSKAIIDVSGDFFYVAIQNNSYSDLKGVQAWVAGSMVGENAYWSLAWDADETTKNAGYFDAYKEMRMHTYTADGTFTAYWDEGVQFEFADGMTNFSVILATGSDFKSNDGISKATSTSGSLGAIKEGDLRYNTPRKASISSEDLKAFKSFK
ncbi:MAG: PKD domain-containing protein [Salinivirgaceae bacterium]|nr:PKD domain-containing protein [Salinivirgaceae bacterium]